MLIADVVAVVVGLEGLDPDLLGERDDPVLRGPVARGRRLHPLPADVHERAVLVERARASADPIACLEHGHRRDAVLHEPPCRRQPRQAGADHHDIGVPPRGPLRFALARLGHARQRGPGRPRRRAADEPAPRDAMRAFPHGAEL